jgi:hypothetical protein
MKEQLRLLFVSTMLLTVAGNAAHAADQDAVRKPDVIHNVWPAKPPGEARNIGAEADLTKPEDRPISGRPIIRLGNVTTL